MRLYGMERAIKFLDRLGQGLKEGEVLEHPIITKNVEKAQKKVEENNFGIRKRLLEYDDVMNKHRSIIYSRRDKILDNQNMHEDIKEMVQNQISALVQSEFTKQSQKDNFDVKEIIKKVNEFLWMEAIDDKIELDDVSNIKDWEELAKYIWNIAIDELEKMKDQAISQEAFFDLEKRVVLSSIDELWMRHIDSMSKLRDEVAFEWYAQRNPLVVYKEKAFQKFDNLINEIEYKVVKSMFSIRQNEQVVLEEPEAVEVENMEELVREFEEKLKQTKDIENQGNTDEVKKIRV